MAGEYIIDFSNFIWGTPLLILLAAGGIYFVFHSRLLPLKHFGHAVNVVSGKYDSPDEPGHINHFQALSTALAGTIGLGNISGVAVAISVGGPGTLFWMWVSALLGVLTKYYTCTLAVMFRAKDSKGTLLGGPMYFITEGLGRKWKAMAFFFAFVGMIGVSPVFQANQLTMAITDMFLPLDYRGNHTNVKLIIGVLIMAIVSLVLFGGIKRIGRVAGSLVPFMVLLYIASVLFILVHEYEKIIPVFQLILHDAFHADAMMGGSVISLIIMGFRRAAFSNEAGIGTAPMAHGDARTSEPVREGLVAMLGPVIDTLIVCTMTALAIIIAAPGAGAEAEGVGLTLRAFETGIPYAGKYILIACVTIFSLTTLFTFPYYGTKCFSFIFGTRFSRLYHILYLLAIVIGSVVSLNVAISIFDSAYALMAFPTMIAAILLSPQVRRESRKYFDQRRRDK